MKRIIVIALSSVLLPASFAGEKRASAKGVKLPEVFRTAFMQKGNTPQDITGITAYEALEKVFAKAGPAKLDDLHGWKSGRVFDSADYQEGLLSIGFYKKRILDGGLFTAKPDLLLMKGKSRAYNGFDDGEKIDPSNLRISPALARETATGVTVKVEDQCSAESRKFEGYIIEKILCSDGKKTTTVYGYYIKDVTPKNQGHYADQ
ncbi:MAG: hypothetical protein WCS77_08170 [Elusimicrobiaceae bacterium]